MDYHCRQRGPNAYVNGSPVRESRGSFSGGLYNLAMLGCLTALVYMMLNYHCQSCNNVTLKNLNADIQEIKQNFNLMQENYLELETNISKLAIELPRVQGQMEILEAFANTLENKNIGWDPKKHLCLPYVDVFLNGPKVGMSSGDHRDETRESDSTELPETDQASTKDT